MQYVIAYMSGCWVGGHVGEDEELTSIIIVVAVVVSDIIVSHIATSVKDDIAAY